MGCDKVGHKQDDCYKRKREEESGARKKTRGAPQYWNRGENKGHGHREWKKKAQTEEERPSSEEN